MNTIKPQDVRQVACVGAGTIGSGWAAYFLSRGVDVTAPAPAPAWRSASVWLFSDAVSDSRALRSISKPWLRRPSALRAVACTLTGS